MAPLSHSPRTGSTCAIRIHKWVAQMCSAHNCHLSLEGPWFDSWVRAFLCSLHVLPVPAWVLYGFLLQSKNMQNWGWIAHSESSTGVNEYGWLFVSMCQPCDELTVCPRCTPPSFEDAGIGSSSPDIPNRISRRKRMDGNAILACPEEKADTLNSKCSLNWELKGGQSPDSPEKRSALEMWRECELTVETGNSATACEPMELSVKQMINQRVIVDQ